MELPGLIRDSLLLALLVGFISCSNKTKIGITANADTLTLKTQEGLYYSKRTLFTGKLFKLDEKYLDTLFVENYLNGKKHGIFKRFYQNNLLLEERTYHKGKKEGLHIRYWPNGKLIFKYNLKNDLYDGLSRSWNQDGFLRQLNHQQDSWFYDFTSSNKAQSVSIFKESNGETKLFINY